MPLQDTDPTPSFGGFGLSNLLGTSMSGFLPTTKVLSDKRWVNSIPALMGHSYTGDDTSTSSSGADSQPLHVQQRQRPDHLGVSPALPLLLDPT